MALKIHQKSIKTPLGIDFSWILVEFGGQVKPSWLQKSNKNRSQVALKNEQQKLSVLTASWSRLKPNKGPNRSAAKPARGAWLSLKLCYGISLDLRRTVGSEGSTS